MYLQEYQGPEKTDLASLPSWQSGFAHLSLRCTVKHRQRGKLSHNNCKLNHQLLALALFEAVAMEKELPLPALD